MDLFSLAWKNLWRNRRRTLITLAALSLSLMLVQGFHNLSFGVYARMVDSGVRAGSGHIAVYRGDYAQSRNEKLSFAADDLPQKIAALPAVQAVLPRVYLPGLAQSSRESRGILLTGVDPAAELAVNPFLRHQPKEQMLRSADGRDALLGSKLMQELKLGLGDKFVVTVQNRDGELASELFRIRGVVKTGIRDFDRSLVMVGRQRAAAMAGIPGQVQELAVILKRAAAEAATLPQIAGIVAGRPQLHALSWQQAMPNLANAIRLDYSSQQFIFVVILLIVTIGVVNTLLMSVMERIREFGVILAVGASPGRLRRLVLAEALLLGLAALVVGSLLGSLLTWYLVAVGIDLRNYMPDAMEFGGVVFEPVLRATWDIAWMVRIALYVVGLALLASLYPAVKAARISPVEAMRHY